MVLLCIKIFLVRILDVSLGTFRTLVTVKGKSVYASIIGFFELLIWFLVVKEALNTDSNSIWIAISYAGGFATGTFIGSKLSQKLIKGNLAVQVITTDDTLKIAEVLRSEGYAVSVIDVKGKDKEDIKYMLFIEINNKSFAHLQSLIRKIDKTAFVVVNETKYVQNGFVK